MLTRRFQIDSPLTVSGSSIAVTEDATKATGVDLVDPTVSGDATAGEFTFQMSALGAGSFVTVDGEKLELADGGTEAKAAEALKTAIEGNATLNDKYEVAVSASTQKVGQETATTPTLDFETLAGTGFINQMQIGGNTGQSMSVDIDDMRAGAIGVSN